MKRLSELLIVAVLAVAVVQVFRPPPVSAHAGSPAPTVWNSGNTLTAAALNDTIAHLHNTFSGNIGNSHLSASAAIAHSKLATPALVSKAWAIVGQAGACVGSATAGTACPVNATSRVNSVTTNGTTGQYRLNLTYTPVNTAFAVLASSMTNDVHCRATSLATAAPHAIIECRSIAGTPAATNAIFSVLVMDDDN